MKSVKRRFAVTFVANLLRAAVSFLSGLWVARWLGVSEYGNLQFLTASILAARGLLDMGTSSAFFTLISQEKRGWRIFASYFLWIFIQFCGFMTFVLLFRFTGLSDKIWLGQPQGKVLLALFSVFAVDALWGTVVNMGESIRQTAAVQWAGLGAACAYALGLLLLRQAGRITVASVLSLNGILYVLLSAGMLLWLVRSGDFSWKDNPTQRSFRWMIAYYVDYCKPLFVIMPLSFLHNFADTWLLQNFGGSRQQGFFGVSQQLAAVSLLASSSFIKVFWKEVSEAANSGNMERTRVLYLKACRLFFFAGAVVSALLIPLTPQIVDLTLGKAYAEAALPLAIMLLYPLQQALGHITHTIFYATAQLRLYVKAAIPQMGFGLLLTYFLLADPHARVPGLGLGAVGLPIKIVVSAVVNVYTNTWLLTRHYGWEFQWKYQISCLGTLLAFSASIVCLLRGASWLAGIHIADMLFLAIAAAVYGIGVVYLLESFPALFGLSEAEYADLRARLLGLLHGQPRGVTGSGPQNDVAGR